MNSNKIDTGINLSKESIMALCEEMEKVFNYDYTEDWQVNCPDMPYDPGNFLNDTDIEAVMKNSKIEFSIFHDSAYEIEKIAFSVLKSEKTKEFAKGMLVAYCLCCKSNFPDIFEKIPTDKELLTMAVDKLETIAEETRKKLNSINQNKYKLIYGNSYWLSFMLSKNNEEGNIDLSLIIEGDGMSSVMRTDALFSFPSTIQADALKRLVVTKMSEIMCANP